jgi:hypothetical protein
MLVKTEDSKFAKDTESGAFINIDEGAYQRFKAQRNASKKTNELCERMNAVEDDLKDIKNLLLQVVNGRN